MRNEINPMGGCHDDQTELTRPKNKDWMTLYGGKRFFPLDPDPDLINIEDIAHSLAFQCRWGGHCNSFFSVAEHCFIVSDLCNTLEEKRWGLLHDASEAYVGDVIRPLKMNLSGYKQIEGRVIEAVAKRFNLPLPMPKRVKKADEISIKNEAEQLFNADWSGATYLDNTIKDKVKIRCWSHGMAEQMYLMKFQELFGGW